MTDHRSTDHGATPGGDRACADAAAGADTSRVALVAFYANADAAHRRLDLLITNEAPMDRISVLGRADTSGDDPLGIYYPGVGERVRGWGGLGALWGGIFGLLGGAAGFFMLPGIGPMIAAGPLVGSLTGAAAGAGAGAGAGGLLMAGAGAGQQLAVAIHRLGIPESCIDDMQERLGRGETLVMMILDQDEAQRWRALMEEPSSSVARREGEDEGQGGGEAAEVPQPVALWTLPFTGVIDAIRE
ncbi:MAG: hypothetical protein K9L70_03750 [Thiohalocapsa sp.]|nr:hypothetical protein [Thiohalocapsa sp.]MCF7989985.1 hypothetical protein [Thiohalocapsa sp.]